MLPSLFTDYTQTTRLLRLSTPLGANTLLAESVEGEEGLDTGFRFTITALAQDARLLLRSLIGQPALLELLTVDRSYRPFHGHVTTVEQAGANGGLARYTLTLAPWTAFLSHNRDSRVFHHMTVRAILDAVFSPGVFKARSIRAGATTWPMAPSTPSAVRPRNTRKATGPSPRV